MSSLKKITVVTNDKGLVIATNQPPKDSPRGGLRCSLYAGPGQKLHEIELMFRKISERLMM